mmetsp:Transcript_1869/g.5586  ORF Transcript_1869/g.5586 Transcript_1869/m.5586 type:complete len:259 (-) Transcript_1869:64-840(-)
MLDFSSARNSTVASHAAGATRRTTRSCGCSGHATMRFKPTTRHQEPSRPTVNASMRTSNSTSEPVATVPLCGARISIVAAARPSVSARHMAMESDFAYCSASKLPRSAGSSISRSLCGTVPRRASACMYLAATTRPHSPPPVVKARPSGTPVGSAATIMMTFARRTMSATAATPSRPRRRSKTGLPSNSARSRRRSREICETRTISAIRATTTRSAPPSSAARAAKTIKSTSLTSRARTRPRASTTTSSPDGGGSETP